MAKVISRILDFVGLEEPREEDQDQDDYGYEEKPRQGRRKGRERDDREEDYEGAQTRGGRDERPAARRTGRSTERPYSYEDERDELHARRNRGYEGERNERNSRKGGILVNHPSAMADLPQQQMNIYQLTNFDETRAVIQDLMDGSAVLVNLEMADADEAQRIVDMLAGAVFALSATLRKAAASTYLLAPDTVDVSGAYDEEPNAQHRRGNNFFGNRR